MSSSLLCARRWRRSFAAVVLLLTVGASTPSVGWAAPAGGTASSTAGPEGSDRAKKFFDAGAQAYDAGQYLVAATAFEEAYRLSTKSAILFSTAQAYRRQYFVDRDPAKLKRAVDLYRQYVDEVAQGGRRDDAVQHLSDLEPLLARVEDEQRRSGKGAIREMGAMPAATRLMITSRTKGAKATVDGAAPGEIPVIREVSPGNHKVRVEADGYFPEELDGTAVEGQLIVVEVPLRERPALLTVRTLDGAEISIDGRPAGLAPLLRPLELSDGKHFVSVAKRGRHPYTRELTLKRGQATSIDAPLEETTQRVLSYWFLGGAGAFAVAGLTASTIGLVAQSSASDLLDRKESGTNLSQDDLDEYNRQRDRRNGANAASYFFYGGAMALGATGALLYFVDHPRVEATPTSIGLKPSILPGGAGAAFSLQF